MSSPLNLAKNAKFEKSCNFRQNIRRHDAKSNELLREQSNSNSRDSVPKPKHTNWEEAQRLVIHRALSRSKKGNGGKFLNNEQIIEMVNRLKTSEINRLKQTELQKETQKRLNDSNSTIEKLLAEKKQLEHVMYQSNVEQREILQKYNAESFAELIEKKEKTIKWLTVRCAEMHNKVAKLAQQLKRITEENCKIKTVQDTYKRKYLKYKSKLYNTYELNAMGKKTRLEQLQRPDPIRLMHNCAPETDGPQIKKAHVNSIKSRLKSTTEDFENPQKFDGVAQSVVSYTDTFSQNLYLNKKNESDNCYLNYSNFEPTCESDKLSKSQPPKDQLPTYTETKFNPVCNFKTEKRDRLGSSYETAENVDLQYYSNGSNSSIDLGKAKKRATAASTSKSMTNIAQNRENVARNKYSFETSDQGISESLMKTPRNIFAEIFGKGPAFCFEKLADYTPHLEGWYDNMKNRCVIPPPSSSYQNSLTSKQTPKSCQQSQKLNLDVPEETMTKSTCSKSKDSCLPVKDEGTSVQTSGIAQKKDDLPPRLTTTIRLCTPGSHKRHVVTVNGKVLIFEPPAPSGWSTLQHEEPFTSEDSILYSCLESSPEMKSLWRNLAIAYARTDLREDNSPEMNPRAADVKTIYTDFDNPINNQPLQMSRRVDAILLADNISKSERNLIKSWLASEMECQSSTPSRKSVSDIQTFSLAANVEEEQNENLDILRHSSLSSLSDTELRLNDSYSDCEDSEQQSNLPSSSSSRIASSATASDESSVHSTSSVTSLKLEKLLFESLELMKTIEEQDSDDLTEENQTMTE